MNELQNLGLCSSGMLHGIGWQCLLMFQNGLSVPYSVVKQSKKAAGTLKMGLTDSSEMLVTSCKSIPRNTPEE